MGTLSEVKSGDALEIEVDSVSGRGNDAGQTPHRGLCGEGLPRSQLRPP